MSRDSIRERAKTKNQNILAEITQKGKTYFERKTRYEKEQKRKSLREWIYMFVGAILGFVIPKIVNIIWSVISGYLTGK